MDKQDIIRWAKEAHGPITDQWFDMDVAALERFAALVAAAEREACAKLFEELAENQLSATALRLQQQANAIRARGNTP